MHGSISIKKTNPCKTARAARKVGNSLGRYTLINGLTGCRTTSPAPPRPAEPQSRTRNCEILDRRMPATNTAGTSIIDWRTRPSVRGRGSDGGKWGTTDHGPGVTTKITDHGPGVTTRITDHGLCAMSRPGVTDHVDGLRHGLSLIGSQIGSRIGSRIASRIGRDEFLRFLIGKTRYKIHENWSRPFHDACHDPIRDAFWPSPHDTSHDTIHDTPHDTIRDVSRHCSRHDSGFVTTLLPTRFVGPGGRKHGPLVVRMAGGCRGRPTRSAHPGCVAAPQ